MSIASHHPTTLPFGSTHLRTDRDNEYHIFSRVTRQIQQAINTADRALLIEAVNMNINLWTTLASDLAQPGNKFSDQLKAGLLSLAIYSIKCSHRTLLVDTQADSLIEINIRIMKGLRSEASS